MLSLRQNGQLSVLRILVGLNVLVFLFSLLLTPMGQIRFDAIFGLSMRGISNGMLWQFVTHQFLHGSLLHLLVNMFGLWFAGRVLENLLGGWKFLLFYLTCGIIGGIFQLVIAPGPILIGASGAVCGVVAAFSALYPEMQITALLFFASPSGCGQNGWGESSWVSRCYSFSPASWGMSGTPLISEAHWPGMHLSGLGNPGGRGPGDAASALR